MVYLAELLVVMTIQPKIIRICARNVSHVHGQKRLDYNTSCVSLSLQESDSVVFLMSWGACHVETQKTRPGTTCACLAVVSKQESCCYSIPSSL